MFMWYHWGLAPGHVYAHNTPLDNGEQFSHAAELPPMEEENGLADGNRETDITREDDSGSVASDIEDGSHEDAIDILEQSGVLDLDASNFSDNDYLVINAELLDMYGQNLEDYGHYD
ncbi:hypothetical protein SERLA73DRAFT_68080 [Serpula lacrymans var. lacrymans S7.3]|uniref:Uncharacterized protein n=2 Tax=Serpula lacrymans var. lacrymans TaxID=341189 RepID=F8PGW0_SERL3|nr:uncharacterized protein SERLADRAFT_431807 [Serpula lacrymans var. lacrymans S7.9]EGO04397.1 hypothetical protein SERLA73DRAFT_68080 [Serpula lacrymans var. lacrymans S7.3]EGO30301.1 hypothetical protein SERLADRAFT_431807 [Serpula lacrymans var. lacrymans S7.9]